MSEVINKFIILLNEMREKLKKIKVCLFSNQGFAESKELKELDKKISQLEQYTSNLTAILEEKPMEIDIDTKVEEELKEADKDLELDDKE